MACRILSICCEQIDVNKGLPVLPETLLTSSSDLGDSDHGLNRLLHKLSVVPGGCVSDLLQIEGAVIDHLLA